MTTVNERVVVWVLGAGFSRSLGAPLLSTLFGPDRLTDIHARFDTNSFPTLIGDYIEAIQPLYVIGIERGLWPDPEAFLDYLDLAASPPTNWPSGQPHPALSRILQLLPATSTKVHEDAGRLDYNGRRDQVVAKLHGAARRLMAAECMAFLEGCDTRQERWQPYWDWLRLVRDGDSVITFNYDLLVETLATDAPNRDVSNVLHVLEPSAQEVRPRCANVLKLHGSVNWRRIGDQYELTKDNKFALRCSDAEVGIASPGSNKLRESEGGLRGLWGFARLALHKADAVVLLGYRFPPTDSHARRAFVAALAGALGSKRHVSAHVVLKENSPDVGRTSEILHYALKRAGRLECGPPVGNGYQVVAQPLSVEDFLTVMSREQLFAEKR